MMISAVATVFLGPFVGGAIDRFGARRIGIWGSVAVLISIALLSTTTSSLWVWWALWTVLALTSVLIKPMVWTAAISSLFTASRGLALAVTLCGTALASTVAPVLCNYLITRYGWRIGYLGLAAFFAVAVLPALFLFFRSAVDLHRAKAPRPGAARPAAAALAGASPREGLLSFRFARLTLAGGAMTFAAVSCMINFVPIVVAAGHSREAAASIAGVAGLSNIFGRLTTGYLLDRIDGNVVAGVSVLMPIAAFLLLLFLPGSVPAIVAASLILGLSIGAEFDTVAYLTTRHFGLRSFGMLFGVTSAALALASSAGPLFANYVFDVTRSYTGALWAYIPISLVGALLFLSLGAYPDFAAAEEEPAPARKPPPRAAAGGG
jgi:MFS family permease